MSLSGADWVKLSQLLDEALDLDPAHRKQWVESLPPEHRALSDTLRDLLLRESGMETSDILLDAPGLRGIPFAAVGSGDLVGPYRLIRELGAGGTATVWLAERADGSLRRQVALKLPRIAWLDRGHFFAYAGRIMRSVVVDFARKRQAERRGGELERVELDTQLAEDLRANDEQMLRINEALQALEEVDRRLVQVVEMRYFVGMTETEIAGALGVAERTVRRDWEKAKLLLLASLR
jgi:RNA polymerase sigma factor (TIGR02999 family)